LCWRDVGPAVFRRHQLDVFLAGRPGDKLLGRVDFLRTARDRQCPPPRRPLRRNRGSSRRAHRHGTAATHDCCGCPAASAVHGSRSLLPRSRIAEPTVRRSRVSEGDTKTRSGHQRPKCHRAGSLRAAPYGLVACSWPHPTLGTRIACRLSGLRANKPTAHGTYAHYIFTQGASGGHWSPQPALTGVSGF
jgi:hypothetical protein